MDLKSFFLWKRVQFFFAVFLSAFGQISFLHGQQNVTAEPGQNIVLPCRAAGRSTVIVVKWVRTDLGSDYVLKFRDEQFDPENQNPSFRNRVDLQDRHMKDGDVSLVLRNVTADDGGSYECRVVQRGESQIRPISSVVLLVVPPGTGGESRDDGGTEDGHGGPAPSVSGWILILVIIIIIIIAAVGLVIYRKPSCLRRKYLPASC
ncbi:uncharacterized protein LOC114157652 [Xiphophorus couchianus]|uniref:uncharacterized protein LOC114157652 n=1 Tax=Xiphophorus couchianus TaxID=32473 RepID=UPI0010163096|nr:uncharacterized protein LOC114157652 [Xiphophorus couchianus]